MIRIKEVNLGRKTIAYQEMSGETLKNYLGGFGVGLRLAWDLIPPATDPLSPENAVIVSAGSLVGTTVPGASKVLVTTKFPMTGAIATGVGGMAFAGQMKWGGLDHLVVKGRATVPAYISVLDDDVEICDASSLWGRDTYETTDLLRREHGQDASVLAIGKAGENLVTISLAMVDKVSSVGKGGLGAVLGSKNLKAIVVRGTKGVSPADSKRYNEALASIVEKIKGFGPRWSWIENGIMQKWEYRAAGFIFGNWTRTFPFEKATELFGPEVYLKKAKRGRISCLSCPIAEKEVLEVREGVFAGVVTYAGNFPGRVSNWGIRCGAESYDQVIKCQDLANRLGICAHSASALIDFAVELYQQNVLRHRETGLELKRDYRTTQTLLDMIAAREGFGGTLGEGYRGMIRQFGKKVEEQAQHMKFMDFQKDVRRTSLDPSEFAQVVNPRGGRHQSGGSFSAHHTSAEDMKDYCDHIGVPPSALPRIFDPTFGFHVGRITAHCEDWYSILNSLGMCTESQLSQFYTIQDCADLFSAVTGISMEAGEMKSAGERIWTLLKMINVREGFSRKDDRFPSRWLEPLETEGGSRFLKDYWGKRPLKSEDLALLLDGYYDEHGWDSRQGIPTPKRLGELGLGFTAEQKDEMGI